MSLIVMIGASCSGKSTETARMFDEGLMNGNFVDVISRDQERGDLFGEYRQGDAKEEKLITSICHQKVVNRLRDGKDVILDNTHLGWKYIRRILNQYNSMADVVFVMMPVVDLVTLNQRNAVRCRDTGKCIPDHVIFSMHTRHVRMAEQWWAASFPTNFKQNDPNLKSWMELIKKL